MHSHPRCGGPAAGIGVSLSADANLDTIRRRRTGISRHVDTRSQRRAVVDASAASWAGMRTPTLDSAVRPLTSLVRARAHVWPNALRCRSDIASIRLAQSAPLEATRNEPVPGPRGGR